MFIRQKLFLNLLKLLNDEVSSLKIQKLFFLYTELEEEKKTYDFIPYNYGCYSFTLYQDELQLEKKNFITVDRPSNNIFSYISLQDKIEIPKLSNEKMDVLVSVVNKYKNYSDNELIDITYKKKPYYSKNSKILDQFKNNEEFYKKIESINYTISQRQHFLFTIGYEKKSVELFINKLIFYNIKLVVDVRCNAYSMKSNFIGATLCRLLKKVNIDYVHLPELGISTKDRKDYIPQGNINQLFDIYYKSLNTKSEYVNKIIEYYNEKNMALMCFELNPKECHRLQLANYCKKEFNNSISIKNI
jgi:uncharacterized protein (DUF488 family)